MKKKTKKHSKKQSEKLKINPWQASTVVLLLALILVLYSSGSFCSFTGLFCKSEIITADSAGKLVVDFINSNLVQGPEKVTLSNVEEELGLYKVTTIYQNQEIPVYSTKDGKYLFLSQPIELTEGKSEGSSTTTGFDAPDKDVPDVELYVMSFCPYGVQAENTMKEVFDLLKDKAKFKIRFIANVNGDTPETVQSLHGSNEAMEDLRQVCIMKYYDDTTYWDYLIDLNTNCYSLYRDEAKLDECWKTTANKFNIDTNQIETCSKSKEAIDLLKADEALTEKYGVRGSPTLIINGKTYNGQRTPEAFKQAVCSGFANPPSECSSNLKETEAAVSGSC